MCSIKIVHELMFMLSVQDIYSVISTVRWRWHIDIAPTHVIRARHVLRHTHSTWNMTNWHCFQTQSISFDICGNFRYPSFCSVILDCVSLLPLCSSTASDFVTLPLSYTRLSPFLYFDLVRTRKRHNILSECIIVV